jgi:hypothetical protein
MFDVSVIVLLVSVIGAIDEESTAVESVVVVSEPLLQAAKAPIAKTINNFFICLCFFVYVIFD